MATITSALAAFVSSTNTTSYTTASFTPASNDLLVVCVWTTGTATAAPTLTGSAGVTAFTKVAKAVTNTSADQFNIFVGDTLSGTTSQTVTIDTGADGATACVIQVLRISGMTRTGSSAVRQSVTYDNYPFATNIQLTFSSSCLTGNPTIATVGATADLVTFNPPSGWTELLEQATSAPATDCIIEVRDSGFTGTVVDWATQYPSQSFALIAIEFDTSAVPAADSKFFMLF